MTNGTHESSDRAKWMALLAALLGWMFDGVEMGIFPLVAKPALTELLGAGHPNFGQWEGSVHAVFLIGAACGGILFGWLGDRIGRVKAMTWSVLAYSVFSGLCAFANAPWQLASLRFCSSLGMGGEWSLGVALVMEVWPGRSRPMMAGLIGASANVGFLFIAVLSLSLAQVLGPIGHGLGKFLPGNWVDKLLANGSWRLLMILSALPAVLTFFIRLFVPESEKWQTASKNAPKVGVADIFRQGLAMKTVLGTGLAAIALLGTWGAIQKIPSWAAGMTAADNHPREWVQIATGLGAIVGTILAALLAEKFSRRSAYFALCALSLLICGWLFRTPQAWGNSFLAGCAVAGGITAAFYGWLPLYLPELFPTRVRATGQGFAFNFGRTIAALGTIYGGQLLDAFGKDYAKMGAVMSLVYAAGLVLIWFCPETKGKPLPE